MAFIPGSQQIQVELSDGGCAGREFKMITSQCIGIFWSIILSQECVL